ncbi:Proclotting enzyme [Amphibalanus amphitrite]|uniref:Proclotting enzyme n=1 Tax=Amphibalanus amphitrite TaxID=1232801 RepID=A0A6A4VQT5_AMPAM|nr:Proclotting enzyme [Amphibalanus amphitrite]
MNVVLPELAHARMLRLAFGVLCAVAASVAGSAAVQTEPGALRDNSSDSVAEDALPLDGQLAVLRQMQLERLLPDGDGLGLTVCGDLPPGLPGSVSEQLNGPVTVRTCRRCQGPFRAELLSERPMLPRALLQGAGCEYWPGARPLPHWSPRPAVLLGRLDCRAALLRPELDRLPDALCLQLDGRRSRCGTVREIGSWSSSGGLQVTDRRTGVQSDGRIITDGTPLRVAFVKYTADRYDCRRSPTNNRTCSEVVLETLMPMYREIQLDLEVLAMPRMYNVTLEFVDAAQFPPLKRRDRTSEGASRAIGLLAAGGADRTWPYQGLTLNMFAQPVSIVDGHRLVSFMFMTARRPPQLSNAQLVRLFSADTWAAIAGCTLLVAALLAGAPRRGALGRGALMALALLLGQSVPLGAGQLPPRHRPLVAVWVVMSLVLTTAYLSDLIKALTVPLFQPPRTAKDLLEQDYRLLTEIRHLKLIYSHSPSPHVRELARTMRVDTNRVDMPRALLQEQFAFTLEKRTMLEFSVEVMRRSDGSVLFDDFNFGSELLGHMLLVRLWSRHHPLVPHRSLSVARMMASGLISDGRFEEQARHLGLRVRARACARRLPSCHAGGVVRPLTVANVRGPLMLLAAGAALALLVLVAELAVARLTGPGSPAADGSDSAGRPPAHTVSRGKSAPARPEERTSGLPIHKDKLGMVSHINVEKTLGCLLTPAAGFIARPILFPGPTACTAPSGRPGDCVLPADCPASHGPPSRRACGFQQLQIKLCCEKRPTRPMQLTFPTSAEPESAALPSNCGLGGPAGLEGRAVPNISGGRPADRSSWPWAALLGELSAGSERPRWLCGGVLLGPRHVLTAAHCVATRQLSRLVVRLGEHDLGAASSTRQERRVARAVVHPQFPAYVVGWGRLGFEEEQPDVLQEALVTVQQTPPCEALYRRTREYDTRFPGGWGGSVLCAADEQGGARDACQGDSGGPLSLERAPDGRFHLIGLVLEGMGCGGDRFPGLYTSVPHYVDWIRREVRRS